MPPVASDGAATDLPPVAPKTTVTPGAESAGATGEEAPAMGVVRPSAKTGAAPVVQGDWLASVCPYLTSEDGTYRSATPAEGHRCTAQEPAATLPLAFQERFCLTDRHPRCEMYKFAQETNANGGIPAADVPPTDPPTPTTRFAGGGGADGRGRPLIATLAGIGGLIVVVVLVVVFMGSCGSGDGGGTTDPDLVPDEQATEAPADTPEPTPTPAPEVTSEPEDTPDAGTAETIWILYEIQPDEALLRVSETFGITRNRIRRENPELEEVSNAEMPGMIIELPIVGEMTLAEAEALPGFVGLVADLEAEAEAES